MIVDDTIKFATDAKFPIGFLLLANREDWKRLERFAALASAAAVAAEREACAKLADAEADEWPGNSDGLYASRNIAAAIRGRGEK